MGRVRAQGGDIGVAQALALAGDDRPFSTLADLNSWTSPSEAVALFNAAPWSPGTGWSGSTSARSSSTGPTVPTS